MPQRGPTNGLMDMVSSEMEDWISNQDNRISSQESATRTGRLPESPATSNFNATNTDEYSRGFEWTGTLRKWTRSQ
uniref:CACTA en-spm transposon protein n=1 Tax=Caenorhabditis tropicalis TaxID=1561998 RepID=A0A1I7UIM6_9PELO